MSWNNKQMKQRYIPRRTKSTFYWANLKCPRQSLTYMRRFAATDLFGFPRRSASSSHFSSQYNYRSAQCKPGHTRTEAILPGLTRICGGIVSLVTLVTTIRQRVRTKATLIFKKQIRYVNISSRTTLDILQSKEKKRLWGRYSTDLSLRFSRQHPVTLHYVYPIREALSALTEKVIGCEAELLAPLYAHSKNA